MSFREAMPPPNLLPGARWGPPFPRPLVPSPPNSGCATAVITTYLVVGAAGSDGQRGERAPQEQLTCKLRFFVVESETDVAVEGTLPPTLLQTLVPLLHIVFR